MTVLGKLKEFRAERTENDVLHLVFDMPGRPMNVFSNAAIAELGSFQRVAARKRREGCGHPLGKAIGVLRRCRSRRSWDWPTT